MAEFRKGSYLITNDKRKLSFRVIHGFISRSYWAAGRKPLKMKKAIKNSICFGLFHEKTQIGFARVISDYATFAYLADVFIIQEYRGRGLAKWFMKVIFDFRELKGVTSWLLATSDAHGLYRKFGFCELKEPEKYMQMKRK